MKMKEMNPRRGSHAPSDELKSPQAHDCLANGQADLSFNRKQKSKGVLIDKDGASSPSPYESSSDTGEETYGGGAVAATASEDDTHVSYVPLSRPPPSTGEAVDAHASRAWYEFDLAVMVALSSPVGHWLIGGDHVKNLVFVLLLIFYLHQLVEGGLPIFYLGTTSYRQPC